MAELDKKEANDRGCSVLMLRHEKDQEAWSIFERFKAEERRKNREWAQRNKRIIRVRKRLRSVGSTFYKHPRWLHVVLGNGGFV
jgi:hypothetical protein